ncbi:hypothetical protein DL89DRAFT_172603 [Linderina pennispora]|uniref:Uncharacterized protein n=1 Tax=Linderina pennispora TaxID=61395 RepID=A0A1Y1W736_9FUNG|nr:uncharacterized protein DL89DRAFT_172603 [Linderina pennispora]ORX69185.1 hypothetical protein DL89DRAFT_172603 [Linderina pennispora]
MRLGSTVLQQVCKVEGFASLWSGGKMSTLWRIILDRSVQNKFYTSLPCITLLPEGQVEKRINRPRIRRHHSHFPSLRYWPELCVVCEGTQVGMPGKLT